MAIRTRQAKNKRDSNGVLTGRPGTVYDVDIKYTAPDGAKKSYTKRGFATKREAAQHEAEIVVICHNGQEGDGSNPGEWRLMPRVWGKGISTP